MSVPPFFYFILSPHTVFSMEQMILNEPISTFNNKIVFYDIDDTLLDTKTLEPIGYSIRIYNLLRSLGCRMVIITAREQNDMVLYWTREQLAALGIVYHQLYLRPSNYTDLYTFKQTCRDIEILNTQMIPLCSVGDNLWDIGPTNAGTPLLVRQ